MAMGDISGKGISAALLMAGLHSAVRAFSLGGNEILSSNQLEHAHAGRSNGAAEEVFVSPANLMRLLNLHLSQYAAGKVCDAVPGQLRGRTRTVRY